MLHCTAPNHHETLDMRTVQNNGTENEIDAPTLVTPVHKLCNISFQMHKLVVYSQTARK